MTRDNGNGSDRIEQVIDMLTGLAAGELQMRMETSGKNDQIDIVITGLNMLAEELESAVSKERSLRENLEEEVQVRTAEARRKTEIIMQLSTPVLEIAEGVLALPIIGLIDRARAQQIVENLLDSIVKTQATTAILDITGVSVIDADIAARLLKTVKAATMLGTRVVLTGVSPETAKPLSEHGLSEDVISMGSLKNGLKKYLHFA